MRSEPQLPPRHAAAGFTLVELLVVVAVIGLLVGVLLPALAGARASGWQLKAANQQKQLFTGLQTWANDNDTQIPGLNTSGRELEGSAGGDPTGSLNRGAGRPVQSFDWMSPAVGATEFSPNRNQRFVEMLDEFRDPSVPEEWDTVDLFGADEIVGSAGSLGTVEDAVAEAGSITAPSYLMPGAWQWAGSSANGAIAQPAFDRELVELPESWFPRITDVGGASRKVAIADGFVNTKALAGQEKMSVEIWPDPTDTGRDVDDRGYGAFLSSTPILRDSMHYGGDTKEPGDFDPRAYRHKNRMNALFWDGHNEQLTVAESQDPGLWYPSGSRIGTDWDPVDRAEKLFAADGQGAIPLIP